MKQNRFTLHLLCMLLTFVASVSNPLFLSALSDNETSGAAVCVNVRNSNIGIGSDKTGNTSEDKAPKNGNASYEEDSDTIRLSPEFLRSLHQAFEMAPQQAPVGPPKDTILTRSLLVEWLNQIKVKDPIATREAPKIVMPKFEGPPTNCMSVSESLGKILRPAEHRRAKMRKIYERHHREIEACYPVMDE